MSHNYIANNTGDCFLSVYNEEPFSLNVWFDKTITFPLLGSGYYHGGSYVTLIILTVFSMVLTIYGSLKMIPFNMEKLGHTLICFWQFFIALASLLNGTTYFSTATASTLLIHLFLEIMLIVLLFVQILGRNNTFRFNIALIIMDFVFSFYFYLFHTTSSLFIQQNMLIFTIVTDLLHPILIGIATRASGSKDSWLYLSMAIIHWFSFYPTIPFCYLTDASSAYTLSWLGLNLIPLFFFVFF